MFKFIPFFTTFTAHRSTMRVAPPPIETSTLGLEAVSSTKLDRKHWTWAYGSTHVKIHEDSESWRCRWSWRQWCKWRWRCRRTKMMKENSLRRRRWRRRARDISVVILGNMEKMFYWRAGEIKQAISLKFGFELTATFEVWTLLKSQVFLNVQKLLQKVRVFATFNTNISNNYLKNVAKTQLCWLIATFTY